MSKRQTKLAEDKFHTQTAQNAGSIEGMVKDIRQCIDASQGTLSLHNNRSSILKTFKVIKSGPNAPLSIGERAGTSHTVTSAGDFELTTCSFLASLSCQAIRQQKLGLLSRPRQPKSEIGKS